MKRFLFLIILQFTILGLFADDNDEITMSSELFLQISSIPEAKLGFTQSYRFPFLQGESPLTKGNNIKINLTAEISPVSLNGIIKTIWTPVAFIELSAGGRAGAGWPLKLFDKNIYGTGFNLPGADGKGEYEGSAFDALLWKVFLGGTFQFDLAAIFPGDWNHVVFLTYHEINLHGNTRAKDGQAWYFENKGEYCNGFNYYGEFVLGYKMPFFIDMVAFMVEMDLFLYDTPGRSQWGDDLIRWHFSNVLNFTITKQLSISLITQFRTCRNFTNFDERRGDSLYYQKRKIDSSNPQRLEFFRSAAIFSYKF